jgi:hypothetical protein
MVVINLAFDTTSTDRTPLTPAGVCQVDDYHVGICILPVVLQHRTVQKFGVVIKVDLKLLQNIPPLGDLGRIRLALRVC